MAALNAGDEKTNVRGKGGARGAGSGKGVGNGEIKKYNTSASDFWTPQYLYDKLNDRFGPFDIDICASDENTKCERYYTIEDDALKQSWDGVCWCNPPYAVPTAKSIRGIVDVYIKKGLEEINNNEKCTRICFLIPCKTDVKYFHNFIFPNATELVFVKGRPNFAGPHSCNKASGCRTAICAVIFEKGKLGTQKYSTL